MTLYRCYFRDRAGQSIGWKPIRSDSDSSARRLAMLMLRERDEIHNLEAWRQADLAFRVSRIDVASKKHSPVGLRWTARRKAELVRAVHAGLLGAEEAYDRYCLSPEEFLEWQDSFQRSGMRELPVKARARHVKPNTHSSSRV